MQLHSSTVAGAASALRIHDGARTGFPFNPSGEGHPGTGRSNGLFTAFFDDGSIDNDHSDKNNPQREDGLSVRLVGGFLEGRPRAPEFRRARYLFKSLKRQTISHE
jgi:hypothetical protein